MTWTMSDNIRKLGWSTPLTDISASDNYYEASNSLMIYEVPVDQPLTL